MNKDYVPNLFGSMVFNEKIMKERLPKQTYKELKSCIDKGKALNINVANIVACAMKYSLYTLVPTNDRNNS